MNFIDWLFDNNKNKFEGTIIKAYSDNVDA